MAEKFWLKARGKAKEQHSLFIFQRKGPGRKGKSKFIARHVEKTHFFSNLLCIYSAKTSKKCNKVVKST